jgi:hypothetical protein
MWWTAPAPGGGDTTIPIVFITGTDPVATGLVATLNRSGGNLTGITGLNVEVEPKRLELLHELVPAATVMAVLVNPATVVGAGDGTWGQPRIGAPLVWPCKSIFRAIIASP